MKEKLAGASPALAAAAKAAGMTARHRVFEAQKTATAAAKWAVDNNLVDYADYGKCHPDVANQWNQSLLEHIEEFPALRANQKFVGTGQAQNKRWYEIQTSRMVADLEARGVAKADAERYAAVRIKKPKVNARTWAHSWSQPDVSGIAVNEKYGKGIEAFKTGLANSVKSGFHPHGCDTYKSVVDHELGHQLDDLLRLKTDDEIQTIYTGLVKGNGVKDAVSGYAATNIQEFIAEAWAEFRNNPAPRDAARAVADIVRARYRSKFPG